MNQEGEKGSMESKPKMLCTLRHKFSIKFPVLLTAFLLLLPLLLTVTDARVSAVVSGPAAAAAAVAAAVAAGDGGGGGRGDKNHKHKYKNTTAAWMMDSKEHAGHMTNLMARYRPATIPTTSTSTSTTTTTATKTTSTTKKD